jgi:hypothetical protein
VVRQADVGVRIADVEEQNHMIRLISEWSDWSNGRICGAYFLPQILKLI